MAKRGKILRDPHAGPGLLMLEGQQHQFFLDGVWKSDVPPKPGLVVEVELDSFGKVVAIRAVPESQIAKEQTERALSVTKKKSPAMASSMVGKFGLPQLIAAGLLILSWFFLTAFSVQIPFLEKIDFTFWQVLGFLNADSLSQALERHANPNAGFYGVLALLAIAGPFLRYFWKDKRAILAGQLPLLFMLLVGILIRSNIQSSLGNSVNAAYGMQRQLQEQAMKAISLGFGTYTSILVSLYFAANSAMQFFEARTSGSPEIERSQRAAA
jgi:hypothetical protein